MGINFEDLFDQGVESVKKQADEFLRVGVPALEVSLQQWGIDTLERMQKDSQAELNTVVKDMASKEPIQGSFGAAVSASVKGTFLQVYGVHILIGVIALIAVGFYLKGKK